MQLIDRLLGYLNYNFNSNEQKELKLRAILKSYPCWGWGHYLLAQYLFNNRNWSAAYVSNSAAKKLNVNSKLTTILDAKIYMQVGRPIDAIQVLLRIADHDRLADLDVIEELVAAYMQMEDYNNAAQVISKIKDLSLLSPGLKVAKEYIATKIVN